MTTEEHDSNIVNMVLRLKRKNPDRYGHTLNKENLYAEAFRRKII